MYLSRKTDSRQQRTSHQTRSKESLSDKCKTQGTMRCIFHRREGGGSAETTAMSLIVTEIWKLTYFEKH